LSSLASAKARRRLEYPLIMAGGDRGLHLVKDFVNNEGE
jgi:hypothetical protein